MYSSVSRAVNSNFNLKGRSGAKLQSEKVGRRNRWCTEVCMENKTIIRQDRLAQILERIVALGRSCLDVLHIVGNLDISKLSSSGRHCS